MAQTSPAPPRPRTRPPRRATIAARSRPPTRPAAPPRRALFTPYRRWISAAGGATPLRVPLVPEFSECTNPDTTHVAAARCRLLQQPEPRVGAADDLDDRKGKWLRATGCSPRKPGHARGRSRRRHRRVGDRRPRRELGLGLHGPVAPALDDAHHGPGERPERGRCSNVTGLRLLAAGRLRGNDSTDVGSTCNVNSTFDTLVPGFAREGKRAVIPTFSLVLTDAGPDGSVIPSVGACPPTCGSGDEQRFPSPGRLRPVTFLHGYDRAAGCSFRLALLTSVSLLALACLASSAHAGDRVYWANDNSPNRISFANLDGSGGGNLSTTGATGGQPRGVAIDVAAGKVYWTNPDGDRISFANLDGSGGGGDLNTTGATVNRPNAAAVYPAAGRIYWANEVGDRISFANLNNTGGGGNLITTGATVNVPIGPAVDPESGRIYWGNANPENKISFANLDGSGGADLNTAGATVNNPHGVALDPVAGRIYWANVWGRRISYANLDGSGGGDLNTGGATVSTPVGVAIDPSARKIYWANEAGNKISFANLDGSGGGDLSTPGATLNGSRSPVLLQAPSGSGAPTIAGGSTAGSVLTCSQGSLVAGPARLLPLPRAPELRLFLDAQWRRHPRRRREHATRPPRPATIAAGHGLQPGRQRLADERRPCRIGLRGALAFGARTLVTLRLAAGGFQPAARLKVVVTNGNGFAVSGKLSARTTRRVSVSRKRLPDDQGEGLQGRRESRQARQAEAVEVAAPAAQAQGQALAASHREGQGPGGQHPHREEERLAEAEEARLVPRWRRRTPRQSSPPVADRYLFRVRERGLARREKSIRGGKTCGACCSRRPCCWVAALRRSLRQRSQPEPRARGAVQPRGRDLRRRSAGRGQDSRRRQRLQGPRLRRRARRHERVRGAAERPLRGPRHGSGAGPERPDREGPGRDATRASRSRTTRTAARSSPARRSSPGSARPARPTRSATSRRPTSTSYKSTSGAFGAYDPANPPSDVATTTTDQGEDGPVHRPRRDRLPGPRPVQDRCPLRPDQGRGRRGRRRSSGTTSS